MPNPTPRFHSKFNLVVAKLGEAKNLGCSAPIHTNSWRCFPNRDPVLGTKVKVPLANTENQIRTIYYVHSAFAVFPF